MITITNSQMTTKGLIQKVVRLGGSVRIDVFAQNILTSDSSSTHASPILSLETSSTATIGNCAFVYSNSASKTNATYFSSGIYMSSTGSLVSYGNLFSLAGLPTGQNAIYNTGSGVVIFGNNFSTSSVVGTSASSISGTLNVSKFTMTAVV